MSELTADQAWALACNGTDEQWFRHTNGACCGGCGSAPDDCPCHHRGPDRRGYDGCGCGPHVRGPEWVCPMCRDHVYQGVVTRPADHAKCWALPHKEPCHCPPCWGAWWSALAAQSDPGEQLSLLEENA